MKALRPVAVVRGLWIAAAALAAASALLSGYWWAERRLATPKPLALPALDAPAPPPSAPLAALPQRNPFDPAGATWLAGAAVPEAEKKQTAGVQDVRGILASNVVSGVFTTSGLIKTGEPFGGGTLEKVSREELVLRMPDGTTKALPLGRKAEDKVHDRLLELFGEGRSR